MQYIKIELNVSVYGLKFIYSTSTSVYVVLRLVVS